MSMSFIAADEILLNPDLLVSVQDFANAAADGNWYYLSFDPRSTKGRALRMTPSWDRTPYEVFVTGADPRDARTLGLNISPVGQPPKWVDPPRSLTEAFTRVIAANIPAPMFAMRVLTTETVQYRVYVDLPSKGSDSDPRALFAEKVEGQ